MAKKNASDVKAPTKLKGYKTIEAPESAFWSPQDPESEHPSLLECAYLGTRTLPARGKFKEQQVVDVQTKDGDYYTIALKGDLGRKWKAAGVQEGQAIVVEWLGFESPTPELPMGMNRYALAIAE